MNDQFNEQKELLTSLKHEISLLQQQVDYLIRNERAIGLLDLDVMMNRTHAIYDRLCSINVGNPTADDENLDIDPKMLNALFGLEENQETTEETEENKPGEDQEDRMTSPMTETPVAIETPEETETLEEVEVETSEEVEVETPEEVEAETSEEVKVETSEENVTETPIKSRNELSEETVTGEEPSVETGSEEDYGFIFKLEPQDNAPHETFTEAEPVMEETMEAEAAGEHTVEQNVFQETDGMLDFGEEPEERNQNVYTTGDEIEMVIPHFDFPTIHDDEEENPEERFPEADPVEEETEEAPQEEDLPEDIAVEERLQEVAVSETAPREENEEAILEEPVKSGAVEEDFVYEPVIFGDMAEKEELGFELETPETLGERMQHEEDHSLAAKLQSQSVRSLRSAIGINDKFLLVNELFSGSMEKYNRSLENLDDLKTLNGALIYLNELRIELQWNSNNEAYKKLLELVHRKFES